MCDCDNDYKVKSVRMYLNRLALVYNNYRDMFKMVFVPDLNPSDYFEITFIYAVQCFKCMGYSVEYHIDENEKLVIDNVCLNNKESIEDI